MFATCKAQLNHLAEQYQLLQHRPYQKPVALPNNPVQVVNVTCFDFKTQLLSLLTDRDLVGNITKLDINPDNPFGKYESPGGYLDCINSGTWYDKATWGTTIMLGMTG